MDFNKLPINLIESILEKCNFPTIVNCKKTCSAVNDIIKRKELDKLDFDQIGFHKQDDSNLDVIFETVLYRNANGDNQEEIDEADVELSKSNVLYTNVEHNKQIRLILKSIKSMMHIAFDSITIDDEFLNIIKEMKIKWKEVTATFYDCTYSISKSDMVSLWNMFQLANENGGEFKDYDENFFDDTLIQQTMSVRFSVPDYLDTPNITDKILELFAERRPSTIEFPKFIMNYTVDGIKNLFKTVIDSRDSSIDDWFIGTIRPDMINFFRMLEEFEEFDNGRSSVTVRPAVKIEGYFLTVNYKKVNSDQQASITVAYIAPPGMFTLEPLAEINVRRGVIQVIRNAQNRIELVEREEEQVNDNEMEL